MDYMTRIISARKARGLTQSTVAHFLQITQQQWSDYERGRNELPIRYLIEICVLLNISADWALGLTNNPQTPA